MYRIEGGLATLVMVDNQEDFDSISSLEAMVEEGMVGEAMGSNDVDWNCRMIVRHSR
jgi:hypothetical protein